MKWREWFRMWTLSTRTSIQLDALEDRPADIIMCKVEQKHIDAAEPYFHSGPISKALEDDGWFPVHVYTATDDGTVQYPYGKVFLNRKLNSEWENVYGLLTGEATKFWRDFEDKGPGNCKPLEFHITVTRRDRTPKRSWEPPFAQKATEAKRST